MKTITIKCYLLALALLTSSVPAQAEIDPFSIYVRTAYPPSISTVAEAANYILAASGYRFVSEYPAPRDAKRIGSNKMPPIARIHRTMPIIDALQLLVGQSNYIVIDHNNRLVSFTREP